MAGRRGLLEGAPSKRGSQRVLTDVVKRRGPGTVNVTARFLFIYPLLGGVGAGYLVLGGSRSDFCRIFGRLPAHVYKSI